VHAIGNANFLFERSQTPYCTIKAIQAFFGVSSSVLYAHSKKARELLQVNGMTIDIRMLPSHAQWQLCGAALASLGRHSR